MIGGQGLGASNSTLNGFSGMPGISLDERDENASLTCLSIDQPARVFSLAQDES